MRSSLAAITRSKGADVGRDGGSGSSSSLVYTFNLLVATATPLVLAQCDHTQTLQSSSEDCGKVVNASAN